MTLQQEAQKKATHPGGFLMEENMSRNNGGLGEGFDLLVIDEAQEYC